MDWADLLSELQSVKGQLNLSSTTLSARFSLPIISTSSSSISIDTLVALITGLSPGLAMPIPALSGIFTIVNPVFFAS